MEEYTITDYIRFMETGRYDRISPAAMDAIAREFRRINRENSDAAKVLDVIKKLVGPIEPYGDSAIDRNRLKNIMVFLSVFDEMHTILVNDILWKYRDDKRGSVAAIVDATKTYLTSIGVNLEN